jgi:hypothetical protein
VVFLGSRHFRLSPEAVPCLVIVNERGFRPNHDASDFAARNPDPDAVMFNKIFPIALRRAMAALHPKLAA